MGCVAAPVPAGDDGRDGVDHLRQVRHLDPVAVPDEDVEVGGDGQRIDEVVALLERPVTGAVPDVPLVVGDAADGDGSWL